MQVLMLYQPHSEYARSVEEFVQNLQRVNPDYQVNLMDVDTVEGTRCAELYDIMQYPAILVLASDGSVLNSWVGEQLPLIDDVAGYLRS